VSGGVERAIRASVVPGAELRTPSRQKPFSIDSIDGEGVVLLLGRQRAWTRLSWTCLEGVDDFLTGRGWVRVTGTGYSTEVDPGTLDGYLKGCVNRATAAWVAALLERAGVAEIDRSLPMRIRRKASGDRDLPIGTA